MDLLAKTLERITYSFHIDETGKEVYAFKQVAVKIQNGSELITYYIRRESRPNVSHLIERVRKVNDWQEETRYKLYKNEKSFENAIKRIEKIAEKK